MLLSCTLPFITDKTCAQKCVHVSSSHQSKCVVMVRSIYSLANHSCCDPPAATVLHKQTTGGRLPSLLEDSSITSKCTQYGQSINMHWPITTTACIYIESIILEDVKDRSIWTPWCSCVYQESIKFFTNLQITTTKLSVRIFTVSGAYKWQTLNYTQKLF